MDVIKNFAVTCGKDRLLKVWQILPKKVIREI